MDVHAGDLDSLTSLFQSLFSPAVSHFLHSLSEKRPDKEQKILPPLADVRALPASGLGRLMDLAQLHFDQIQPCAKWLASSF
ncbi:TPA: hypothetical protein ACH3X1_009425 [Trebouxia sp. C0004]